MCVPWTETVQRKSTLFNLFPKWDRYFCTDKYFGPIVTYWFHNLFQRIFFLIGVVNWISRPYEHNKSNFFSALWPDTLWPPDISDFSPKNCTTLTFLLPCCKTDWRRQLVSAATLKVIDSWWNLECFWQCFFLSRGGRSNELGKFSLTFFFLEGVKFFLDIWGNVGPCSFLFFLRFLWRCQPSHRAHLFSSTGICVAQRTGFLAPSHQISSPTHSYFLHF